jgi:hypothetical protein
MGYVRFKAAESSGVSSYNVYPQFLQLAQQYGLNYEDLMECTIEELQRNTIDRYRIEERKQQV